MTDKEATTKIDEEWHKTVEECVGYAVQIEEALTVEHSWGWVVCFVPLNSLLPKKKEAIALDRFTGESVPVGTKGLEQAVHVLMSRRPQLGVESEG